MKIFFASLLLMFVFSFGSSARPSSECTFNCYCSAKQLQRGCTVYYTNECDGPPDSPQNCVQYPNCNCAKPSPPDDNCTFNCFCSPKQLKRGCRNYTSRECTGDQNHQTCLDYPNCDCR